ncbi:MAG: M23 family metallopeptidase [Bacteroidales bacterium]|jgi:murein DD-endopeptidase MepM/ murein hydrolase activator NlpD|nr:M23 family metallopeptidase [Bacteroidales bacterium]HOI32771.1 M23 family metallopeptidase [Bacteroidales bacterium]
MRYLLVSFLVMLNIALNAQQHFPKYRSPLDIPVYLSGTFAELRSNHFHSGIDIRTQGVEGHKVFAIGDGFVSRIAVSPFGFGRAIYVNHPEGYTSVYGHLQRFSPEIEAYVKQEQYRQRSFTVNLYLDSGQFPLKEGQFLGLSGNSGSSGGPHLHFEIRDAATQEPMNPLYFGIQMKDFIRPAISHFAVYPVNDSSFVMQQHKPFYSTVQGWGEQHRLPDHRAVELNGTFAFGIAVVDQHNDTPNKNGVYLIRLLQDSTVLYEVKADRFSFGETRYINSYIDYAYYQTNKKRLIRTAVDPLNKLSLYEKSDGIVEVRSGDTLQLIFEVLDFNQNRSLLPFTLIGIDPDTSQAKVIPPGILVKAGTSFSLEAENFRINIPKDVFYKDEYLLMTCETDSLTGVETFQIGDRTIPVHKAFQLAVRPPDFKKPDKLYIAYLDEKNEISALKTKLEKGFLHAEPRVNGRFMVLADTLKPEIKFLNFGQTKSVSELTALKVKIEDKETGIDTYIATLNGEWLLMEYDAKNKLLIYEIDERLKQGENYLRIEVKDQVGNQAIKEVKLLN